MPKLIHTALMSLDGYIEGPDGRFGWAAPDGEVHAYLNDLLRPVGTHLYGRRMYDTMIAWQTLADEPWLTPAEADFAQLWTAADKVVYSRTLDAVSTPRTRLERDFDADAVRALKAAATHDLSISGPNLAEHAFAAGLVDEVHVFVSPLVVGGGKPAFPTTALSNLDLVDQRRFTSGVVHLHYALR